MASAIEEIMNSTYEKDITDNLGNHRNLILLVARADADIQHLNKAIEKIKVTQTV